MPSFPGITPKVPDTPSFPREKILKNKRKSFKNQNICTRYLQAFAGQTVARVSVQNQIIHILLSMYGTTVNKVSGGSNCRETST